jgi:HPt (histidine-containing phosphotransfer) domain-containing protein
MPKISVKIPPELMDIAPAYLERRKADLAVLKDALTRKDFEFIAQLCHKTKGTAGGYGFDELTRIAKALELAAKARDVDTSAAEFAAMVNYLRDVEMRA